MLCDKEPPMVLLDFLCWPPPAGQVALKVLVSPVRLPWRKLNFHLQVVTNWRKLLGYSCGHVSASFGSRTLWPHVAQTPAGPVHAQSLWVHMYVRSTVFRRPCFLSVFYPSGSYILSASSSTELTEPWGEEFDWDILPFRVVFHGLSFPE